MTGLKKVPCPGNVGWEHVVFGDGHERCLAPKILGEGCEHVPGYRPMPARGPYVQPDWQMSNNERRRYQSDRHERGSSSSLTEQRLAWKRADAEAEALFDAEQAGADDEPVLSSLTNAPSVPEPSILELPDGTYLFRKGWIHWIHGKGGSGKTPVCYIAAIGVLRAGGRVLIVDHEMSDAGAFDLLRDLAPDLSDGQIDAQVRYMYEKPLHYGRVKEKLLSELDGFTPDFAIVDAVTGSMAEGSQNDNGDVNRWFRAVPQWLRDQFGAAVVVIDHSNREDGPMPSGSARKHGAPEFRLWVRLVRDFNPDHEDGCSLLEVRKERGRHARTGKVVGELRTVLGGSFVLRAVDKVTSAASGDEVEVDLGALPYSHQVRLDIMQELQQKYGDGGALTTDLTARGAEGQVKRKALTWLWEHGQVAQRREPGSARGMRWWAPGFAPDDAEFYGAGDLDY